MTSGARPRGAEEGEWRDPSESQKNHAARAVDRRK